MMTTFTRAAGKAFSKSLKNYEYSAELVTRAVHPTNPTLVKSHSKNRITLEESFLELNYDWDVYKTDLGISETEFNEEEEGAPKYKYNDKEYNLLPQ